MWVQEGDGARAWAQPGLARSWPPTLTWGQEPERAAGTNKGKPNIEATNLQNVLYLPGPPPTIPIARSPRCHAVPSDSTPLHEVLERFPGRVLCCCEAGQTVFKVLDAHAPEGEVEGVRERSTLPPYPPPLCSASRQRDLAAFLRSPLWRLCRAPVRGRSLLPGQPVLRGGAMMGVSSNIVDPIGP